MIAWLIRHLFNPIVWKLLGSNRIRVYRTYQNQQFYSKREIDRLQRNKLWSLLIHAQTHVPYYQDLLKDTSITKQNVFEILKSLPPLTKTIIRKEQERLLDPKRVKKAQQETSGGSTGEPIVMYHDQAFLDGASANRMLFNQWAGREEGELVIKLWGSERDIFQGSEGFRGLLVRYGMRLLLLNTFVLDEQKIKKYIAIINKKKPVLISGYVSSLVEFAKYISSHDITLHIPKYIMSNAGTLSKNDRQLIEKAFKTKVLNKYGSRETGDMACQIQADKNLLVNSLNTYVEVLDKDMKPTAKGELYITNLENHVMPLLRYKIGDVATLSIKSGSHGRHFQELEHVHGRTVNLFRNKKGQNIDGEYFTHLFYFIPWIKQFKVIQKTIETIHILIVTQGKKKQEDIDTINQKIRLVMGKVDIKWKYVETIPPSKSGKYIYTYSEVNT